MEVIISFLILSSLIGGFFPIQKPPKNELNILVSSKSPVRARENIRPFSEFKDQYTTKQTYDYSCGSAALATLLTYHLGESLTEQQVIHGLLKFGNKRSIAEKRAFSLLDMKSFVKMIGYKGIGYKATMDDLRKLDAPGIVPLDILNYRHFVVLKGIYKEHVFVADPWQGNTSFTVSEFQKKWHDNVLFMVYPEGSKELGALRIRESDLRFIDEEITREILFTHEKMQKGLFEEQRLREMTSGSSNFIKR